MSWTVDVALVQAASTTDPARNRERLVELVPVGHDLVVLPEASQCDFGRPEDDLHPEDVDGPFARELARLAGDRTLVAGLFERTEDKPFNTLVVTGRDTTYRKIHLYDSFGYRESDRLTPGPTQPTVLEVGGAQIGLMTCYDLRFPELARALVEAGAEVLVVPSAWVAGSRKLDHWRTLVRARAIENTVFVAAVDQPGPAYTGHSMIVDPLGDVLAEAGEGEEVVSAVLTRAALDEARRVNPSLLNRRLYYSLP